MSIDNWIIVSHSLHPHYESVKNHPNFLSFEDALENLESLKDRNLFDLTILPTAQKEYWLDELSIAGVGRVIAELGAYWVPKFLRNYPIISSSFSSTFYSPKNRFEVAVEIPGDDDLLKDFGQLLALEPFEVKVPELAFTFGQTLSMIINEAFFAIDEDLASKEDIDKAMQNGVNYPLGPFQWAQKSGHIPIVNLLDELYSATGNPRYRVCPKLRMHQ